MSLGDIFCGGARSKGQGISINAHVTWSIQHTFTSIASWLWVVDWSFWNCKHWSFVHWTIQIGLESRQRLNLMQNIHFVYHLLISFLWILGLFISISYNLQLQRDSSEHTVLYMLSSYIAWNLPFLPISGIGLSRGIIEGILSAAGDGNGGVCSVRWEIDIYLEIDYLVASKRIPAQLSTSNPPVQRLIVDFACAYLIMIMMGGGGVYLAYE